MLTFFTSVMLHSKPATSPSSAFSFPLKRWYIPSLKFKTQRFWRKYLGMTVDLEIHASRRIYSLSLMTAAFNCNYWLITWTNELAIHSSFKSCNWINSRELEPSNRWSSQTLTNDPANDTHATPLSKLAKNVPFPSQITKVCSGVTIWHMDRPPGVGITKLGLCWRFGICCREAARLATQR